MHELSLHQLEDLFHTVFDYYPDYPLLLEAYQFAKKAHAGLSQTRHQDTNIPYIVHPLRMVIRMYSQYYLKDINMLIAALLHDVVEDTDVSQKTIEAEFGKKVGQYVKALTRKKDPREEEFPEIKYHNKIKAIAAYMNKPYKLRVLKLQDIMDNMGDWPYISAKSSIVKKLPRWLSEFQKVYLPLAESVGPKYVKPMKRIYELMLQKGYKPEEVSFQA